MPLVHVPTDPAYKSQLADLDVHPPRDWEWERAHQNIRETHIHTNGKLNTIILGVASVSTMTLLGLGAWAMVKLIDIDNRLVRIETAFIILQDAGSLRRQR